MSTQSFEESRKQRINKAQPIAVSICVVLLVLTGCAPTLGTVARTTDQNRLSKIALEAEDRDVRFSAVEKLTDQALLAKIAVEAKDYRARYAAVKKLTDQIPKWRKYSCGLSVVIPKRPPSPPGQNIYPVYPYRTN